MAIINILFPTGPQRAVIGAIELDATLRESHRRNSVVSSDPIETGSSIQDHIFNEPEEVELVGEVTDSPVTLLGGLIGLTERSLEAFEELERIHEDRELVTVVTRLKVYEDMAMTSFSAPRSQGTGKRLQFVASFQKIVKVATRTADLPKEDVAPEKRDRAQSQTNRGKQTTKPADTATTEAAKPPAEKAGERSGSVLHDVIFG